MKNFNREAIKRMFDGRTGGGGVGSNGADLAGYATQMWVNQNYVSIEFFNRLFSIHGHDPEDESTPPTDISVLPNDMDSIVDSIESMVGLWTEEYLSALGQNSEQGGGGITLNAALASINNSPLGNPTGTNTVLMFNGTTWVYATMGSTDMSTVWNALAGSTDEQINISHLTTALSGYVTTSTLSGYALESEVTALGSDITTLQGYFTSGAANSAVALKNARTIWGQSFDGTANITGDITQATCLEFSGIAGTATNGGFIDFHYAGGGADYTSRIIEDVSGVLKINNTIWAQLSGNVSIGTSTISQTYKLDVAGYTKTTRLYLADGVYLEYDSTNSGVHLVGAGFYSDSYVSALGVNSGGGGGTDYIPLTGSSSITGTLAPSVATADLGSSTNKWRNIYGTSLSISNTLTTYALTVNSSATVVGSITATNGNLVASTGYVSSAGGYKVTGKDDTYVLLAGGGTALLSSIGGGTVSSISLTSGGTSLTPTNGVITFPAATASEYGIVKVNSVYGQAVTFASSGQGSTRNYGLQMDSTGKAFVYVPWEDNNTDTKNTAGATNLTSTILYLVGATEQSANPQTYSNSNCYIGTDNCLYSGGSKVLTVGTYTLDDVADGATRKLSDYLPLTAGDAKPVTGILFVKNIVKGWNYTNSNNAAAFVFDKNGSNATGIGSHNISDTIWFGACNSAGAWIDTYKQIWQFNGEIKSEKITIDANSTGFLKANGTIDTATYVASSTLNNYVSLATTQTISGQKTMTGGLIVEGRIYGGGDDEGILIKPASNGYAGLILGSSTENRFAMYLLTGTSTFSPYFGLKHGSSSYSINVPLKSGTIALTSDIPTVPDVSSYINAIIVNDDSPVGATNHVVTLSNIVRTTGSTMTGKLTVKSPIFGYNYNYAGGNKAAFIFDKPGGNYTGIGAHSTSDTIWFGACSDSDGTWVDSHKQKWQFNGQILAETASISGDTSIAGTLSMAGNIVPSAAFTQNVGTTDKPFASMYSQDYVAKKSGVSNMAKVYINPDNHPSFGVYLSSTNAWYPLVRLNTSNKNVFIGNYSLNAPLNIYGSNVILYARDSSDTANLEVARTTRSGHLVISNSPTSAMDSSSYMLYVDGTLRCTHAYDENGNEYLTSGSVVTISGAQSITGSKTFTSTLKSSAGGNFTGGLAFYSLCVECASDGTPNSGRSGEINRYNNGDLHLQYDDGTGSVTMCRQGFTFTNTGSTRSITINASLQLTCGSGTPYTDKNWVYNSDMRKKDVVRLIDMDVQRIADAPIFDFTWKSDAVKELTLGSSAQYWQTVFPNAVRQTPDCYLGMDYSSIALASAVLAARKVVDHEARIRLLEVENAALRNEINQLKKVA